MQLVKAENMASRFEGFVQLPAVRQIGIIVVFAASIALALTMVLWMQAPSYGVLVGGLSDRETSQIMDVLQQQSVEYKIDERTGAIMVPAAKVHEVRLQLAKEGLPKSSGMGLEALGNKQEFGTSQFMETTRYKHMLETELARSIITINSVESARVHLALPKQTVFVRKKEQPSASVLVNLYAGRTLETGQVAAIAHLVASSIPHLEPSRVTVVDQHGRLLSTREHSPEMAASQEQLEYTRRVEADYVQRIEGILGPIVGRDRVRAQVTAGLDFTVTERTQENYQPNREAIRSEQISEERSSRPGAEGVPGALSNQPPGEATVPERAGAADAAEANPISSRRNSTTNFELDRTISHTRVATGAIQRLSIAVVVDDRTVLNEEGVAVRESRTPEEIERLTALVREAVGYNAQRGDTVNVVNAPFTGPEVVDVPEPPLWQQPLVQEWAGKGLAVVAFLLFILLVLRPLLRNLASIRPQQAAGVPVPADGVLALPEAEGELGEDRLSLTGGVDAVKLPAPGAYEQNIDMVKKVVKEDPKLVAQVVKTWVAND